MALTGNETLYVLATQSNGQPAATTEQTTTAAIAALASNFQNDSPTSITTVGNGVLTASALISGLINRSGPTGNFTDTTDTAAAIVSALGGTINDSFYIDIKNTTAFVQTLAAGTGVTMSTTNVVPPNSVGEYLVVVNSATAVTFNHVLTSPITTGLPLAVTTLTTVGAGVITGADIVSGITTRGGAQSSTPFSDTTDTAANIILAQANPRIGQSWNFTYQNLTNATATILGGTGVTVSGMAVVPANGVVTYLITYTAAATLTMAAYENGSFAADSTDPTKIIGFSPAGNSTGVVTTITTGATVNQTLKLPTQAAGTLAIASPGIQAVGATLAVTAAMSGQTLLLNTAAGSTATLPAATGSGSIYKFVVSATTTSNAHKILAASVSDFVNGIVTGENANTAKCFASAAATNHSIQMPFTGTQPSGGFIGDWFEFTDIAANLWTVRGMYQAGTTPTTPFSAATT